MKCIVQLIFLLSHILCLCELSAQSVSVSAPWHCIHSEFACSLNIDVLRSEYGIEWSMWHIELQCTALYHLHRRASAILIWIQWKIHTATYCIHISHVINWLHMPYVCTCYQPKKMIVKLLMLQTAPYRAKVVETGGWYGSKVLQRHCTLHT